VRGAAIDHLQYRIEHADDGAERAVFAFGESPQAVEMAKKLIGPVDKVNDHEALLRIRLRPLNDREATLFAAVVAIWSMGLPRSARAVGLLASSLALASSQRVT
jgi:hypothetical protein